MNTRFLFSAICSAALTMNVGAQSPETNRQIEKASKETLPAAVRLIEQNTDAKMELEVDTASFGDDEKAWSNLYIVVHRIVSALTEIGKDQVGKDALAKGVRKVVIVKTGADVKEDSIELKNGLLTVKTAATDQAVTLLQGVIAAGLEKVL